MREEIPSVRGEGSLALPNIYNKLVAAEEDLIMLMYLLARNNSISWCKRQQQLFEESLSSDPPRNIYSIPVDMFMSPDSREEHILEAYYLQQRNQV